jgi:predicted DNA-binding transcriptional regulator YafY
VTKAIHQNLPLEIQYRSLFSGLTTRVIVPFALVDNGLRWHVRAYDRNRARFSDFVINRITSPKLLKEAIPHDQSAASDNQWNRIVEMQIVSHPKIKHSETIEAEYGMVNGILNVEIRAAVAGYVLRRWNVDCSEDHSLNGPEIHLWLKNRASLYGVSNLAIAPGYSKENLG